MMSYDVSAGTNAEQKSNEKQDTSLIIECLIRD